MSLSTTSTPLLIAFRNGDSTLSVKKVLLIPNLNFPSPVIFMHRAYN